nr:unnamed protein product [Digitaria exilis]
MLAASGGAVLVDAAFLDAAPLLRCVDATGIRVDHADVAGCARRGVAVADTARSSPSTSPTTPYGSSSMCSASYRPPISYILQYWKTLEQFSGHEPYICACFRCLSSPWNLKLEIAELKSMHELSVVYLLLAYKKWILKIIEEYWNLFHKKFVELWNKHKEGNEEVYLPDIYNSNLLSLAQKRYMTNLFHDSLGFGSAKIIRLL